MPRIAPQHMFLVLFALLLAPPVWAASTDYAGRVMEFPGNPALAYWRLNDGLPSATTAVDEVELDPNDALSLGRNPGTYQGGPAKIAGALQEAANRAMGLDATDDALRIPDSAEFSNRSEFTIMFWVRFPSDNTDSILLERAAGNGKTFRIGYTTSRRMNSFGFTSGDFEARDFKAPILYAGFDLAERYDFVAIAERQYDHWYHMAITYDGQELAMYMDGMFIESRRDPNAVVHNLGTGDWVFGGKENGTERFKGAIDDISIHAKAMDKDNLRWILRAEWPTAFKRTVAIVPRNTEKVVGNDFKRSEGFEYVFDASSGLSGGAQVPVSGWFIREHEYDNNKPNLDGIHVNPADPNGTAVYLPLGSRTRIGDPNDPENYQFERSDIVKYYPDKRKAEHAPEMNGVLGRDLLSRARFNGFSIGPNEGGAYDGWFYVSASGKAKFGGDPNAEMLNYQIWRFDPGDPNTIELFFSSDDHLCSRVACDNRDRVGIDALHVIDAEHILVSFNSSVRFRMDPAPQPDYTGETTDPDYTGVQTGPSPRYRDGDLILLHMHHGSVSDNPGVWNKGVEDPNFMPAVPKLQFAEDLFNGGAESEGAWMSWKPTHLDRFELTHDGFGINCKPETITITARDRQNEVIEDYEGPIRLWAKYQDSAGVNTLTGRWSKIDANGILAPEDNIWWWDFGVTYYNMVKEDEGTATLAFNVRGLRELGNTDVYIEAEAQIQNVDGQNVFMPLRDDMSGVLSFSPQGFTFSNVDIGNPPDVSKFGLGRMIAGPDSYAESTANLHITAWGSDPTSGDCGVIEAYTGTKDVRLYTKYDSPTKHARSVGIVVDGVASQREGDAGDTVFSLEFEDGQLKTPLKLNYPDMGRISLVAVDDSTAAAAAVQQDPNGPATGIIGEESFVVLPKRITVQAVEDPNDSGIPGNRATGGAAEAPFMAAGENFKVVIKAEASNGAALPSFGRETGGSPAFLTHELGDPSLAHKGVLTAVAGACGSTFCPDPNNPSNDGFLEGQFQWNEVGSIKLGANLAAYLGDTGANCADDPNAPCQAPESPFHVGRFVPAKFVVTEQQDFELEPHCPIPGGSFSYMGQPLDFVDGVDGDGVPSLIVEPQNANNGRTRNYQGAWKKMSTTTLSERSYSDGNVLTLHGEDGGQSLLSIDAPVADLDVREYNPLSDPNDSGRVELRFDVTDIKYQRSLVGRYPEQPFNSDLDLQVKVTDAEAFLNGDPNNSVETINIDDVTGNHEIRFGRVRLQDVYGSELEPLDVPISIEYHTGNGNWAVSETEGDCPATNLTPKLNLITGDPALFDVDGGLIDPNGRTYFTATPTALGLILSAPGASRVGTIDMTLDLSAASGEDLSFLQYDWDKFGLDPNSVNNLGQNPTAEITFGIYEGRDELIYMRELY